MEEKLFNPGLTATPGKPAGKQQSTFKSTQGKANYLVMFSAEIPFRLNLVLNQMQGIVCCIVMLLLDLNCTISRLRTQPCKCNKIYCFQSMHHLLVINTHLSDKIPP